MLPFLPLIHELRINNYICSLLAAHFFEVTEELWSDEINIWACPLPRRCRFDQIAVRIIGAGLAGETMRLGLYDSNGNLYPNNLLVDSGPIDISTTGLKTVAIDITQDKGMYWLCWFTDSDTVIIRGTYYSLMPIQSQDLLALRVAWWRSYTYNALPDPFPAGASQSHGIYNIGLRLAQVF